MCVRAAAAKNTEGAKLLLEAGADVNATQTMDYTPLHSAASGGDEGTLELLLATGADVNAVADGKTPAMIARERGHASIAERLELAQ